MNTRRKVLFLIIVIIYIGFFTSYLYIPESSAYLRSDLNQPYTLTTGKTVTIVSWTYSEEQGSMEVELSINDFSFDSEKLEYYATSRTGNFSGRKEVSCSIIIDTAFYKVIHLNGIDENFREISFSVISRNADSELRLYSNINDIEKVELIKTLTYEEYQYRRLGKLIQAKKDEIQLIRNSISECNTKLINIASRNRELEDQKAFSTRNEIYDLDQEINSNLSLMAETEEQILELETMIFKIESEIEEIEETLNEWAN